MSVRAALDALFKPQSVALIGASEKPGSFNTGKTKLMLHHYPGPVFLVHPRHDTIMGRRTFPSVLDIPETPSMALVMVPARQVPQVVEECGRKGVAVVQILSSGFGECGEEGRALEAPIRESAARWNMRIVGPNCIGTYCPASGIHLAEGSSSVPGRVGLISQSGGMAVDFAVRGNSMGLRYSKLVSIGNCLDLNHTDFLEYLTDDEETDIIGLYVESVRDGQRFLEALRRATARKPVVILKGGRTEAGNRAAASHTGGLAGSYRVWQAVFRQTGAIEVRSTEEMLGVLSALESVRPSQKGIAMVGNGGGATVLATDSCLEEGLHFAELSAETSEKLVACSRSISPKAVNPIDLTAMELCAGEGETFGNILRLFSEDEATGCVMFHLNLISFTNQGNLPEMAERMAAKAVETARGGTSVVAVLRYSGDPAIEQVRCSMASELGNAGIPVFMSLEEALHAVSVVNHWAKKGR